MDKIKPEKDVLEGIFRIFDRKKNLVTVLLIIGAILIMEGFVFIYSTLNHWFSHLPILALFTVFSIGSADLLLVSLYLRRRGLYVGHKETYETMAPYLKKIDRYFPISNRYVSVFTGLGVIVFAFIHPLFGIGKEYIGDADIILILLGGFLVIYTFIPRKYNIERDFILTFFAFLAVLMAIIPALFDMFAGSFEYYFLTLPVHHMLDLIGIRNSIVSVNVISYFHNGYIQYIKIARSCSGIYSFSIFTSAFIGFVLVVYRKIDIKSSLFLVLGIVLAYIGNVIRMTIVIASGHYYGQKTMKWVHENLGYLIFFLWMAFFWILLYHFLMREKGKVSKNSENNGD